MSAGESRPDLPPRDPAGHKGTFGTVTVLGGQCEGPRIMIGGPALAGAAALRAGAGLAVLAVPRPIVPAALTIVPSATALALPVDERRRLRPSETAAILDAHVRDGCLAVGPGLGTSDAAQQIVVRLVADDERPLVLDADALNCLAEAGHLHGDLRAPAILTPHPGEFARLAGALGLGGAVPRGADRSEAAADLARRLGCVVVLKGAGAVITDGLETTVNPTGNAALATGGSGDVLTGVIAAFVAQFHRPPGGLGLLDSARLACRVHGRAADAWAAEHGDAGMLATDLLDRLPAAMAELRAGAPRPGGAIH